MTQTNCSLASEVVKGGIELENTLFPFNLPSKVSNFTLSTVCPACGAEMIRLKCKVICPRMCVIWDCGEL